MVKNHWTGCIRGTDDLWPANVFGKLRYHSKVITGIRHQGFCTCFLYIVLTSSEEHKIRKSIDTLKRTFDLADRMGANVVVLHPGSYYASDPDKVFDTLTRNLHRFFQESGPSHIGLFLETAGKKGNWVLSRRSCN